MRREAGDHTHQSHTSFAGASGLECVCLRPRDARMCLLGRGKRAGTLLLGRSTGS